MKIQKEKGFIYSIVILIFGWLYFFLINYLNHVDFIGQFQDPNSGLFVCFPRRGKYDTVWFKSFAMGFGVISLYFSYISKLLNQRKLRILLISISLLLIIMSIIAFPNLIWKYSH